MEEKFYTDIAVFDSQQKFYELTKQSSVKYHFKNCRFFNITFSDDTLTGNMENCHFNRCTFENFNGQKLNLNGSEFSECKILNSNFENAYFEGADIYRSEINNSYFKLSDFSIASIRNTVFKGNNLSSALFYGATLDDVTLKDTITEQAAQGLTLDDITIDGAAHQEIEANRLQILKQLKIEPVSAQQIYKNAKAELEPLPEPKIKNKQIKFKIEPADSVTEYLYNVQVHFKYDFTDEFIYSGIGRFCKNIDEVDEYIKKIETEYSKDGYMFSYEGREELVQQQHLDKLKIIAEYEQRLNVSPEERIVEMNYSTAHWQPKNNITPDQAEVVYDYITNNKRIGFDRSNEMRQSVGKSHLTPDEYYHNIKNMAYVTRFNFGNKNSIDIEAIQSALKEVPIEYVISQMTDEQFELYADYYETAVDYSGGLELGLSQHDTELYNHIISFRNNTSISNKVLESKIEPEIKQELNQLSKNSIKPNQSKSLTKEEFDKLTSEIKEIAKTYQSDPDLLADYFAFKAQFYQYSPTNALLIHLQNPYATFVASFTKWKELGYSIKKGQHHIKISRPIEVSKFPRNVDGKTVWNDVKYATPEEKAKIASGELEIKKTTKFIPHQVFDISQTDCPVEDYPKFYNMGHPDMEQQQLYECVKEYAKESGFTVKEEDLSSISLHGYYDRTNDSIHINSLLEDSQRLRTMCHELAHGVLHKTSTQPVEIMEFEAECFSAMLNRKMGFPITEESKRYIKQYFNKSNALNNGKFDMSKTLNRLSKTFNHISNGIDKTISDMGFSQERELAHSLSQANSKAVDVAKISENFMQALS